MPDPAWKNERFSSDADKEARNNEWYLGDTYHVAIGQGYLLTTPLQVNAWTNVIANKGKVCKPTVKKATSVPAWRDQVSSCKNLGIKDETIQLIAEGMKKACETGGTGWPLFEFKVKSTIRQLADKTGTAEFGDPQNKTHAWFTVYAPLSQDAIKAPTLQSTELRAQGRALGSQVLTGEPEISITVLVEGAGEGSSVAAPVAKKILEEWFGR